MYLFGAYLFNADEEPRETSFKHYQATAVRFLSVLMLLAMLCAVISRAQAVVHTDRSAVAAKDANAHETNPSNLKFEVVSIKPTGNGVPFDEKFLPDGFERTHTTLSRLILMAYFPTVLGTRDRLENAPDWAMDDLYDLVGKVSTEDMAEWQKDDKNLDNKALQSALQAALKDRCKLVAHRIPAQIEGFDLFVAKRGPGPKVTLPDEVFPPEARPALDGSRSGFILDMANNRSKLVYYNATMEQFIASFSFVSGFPIQNKTGLAGRYDIVLNDTLPIRGAEPGLYASLKPAERYDFKPTGLRLQQTMVPTTTLVIDHIERPSPN